MQTLLRAILVSLISIGSCADFCGCGMSAVALGDSITLGVGGTTPYPALVAPMGSLIVVNAGISGDTTANMLTRWTATYKGGGYSYLFLMGGSNDADPTVALTNLVTIASQAVALGLQVRLLLVTPCAARATNISALNASLRSYANTAPSAVRVLDTFTPLSNGNALAAAYDSGDGLHPNQAGYNLIASIVRGNL